MNAAYYVVIVVGFGAAVTYMWMLHALKRMLRERHPDTFQALGGSAMLPMSTRWGTRSREQSKATSRLLLFVLKGEFRELNDRRLDAHCSRLRLVMALLTLTIVAAAAVFIQMYLAGTLWS